MYRSGCGRPVPSRAWSRPRAASSNRRLSGSPDVSSSPVAVRPAKPPLRTTLRITAAPSGSRCVHPRTTRRKNQPDSQHHHPAYRAACPTLSCCLTTQRPVGRQESAGRRGIRCLPAWPGLPHTRSSQWEHGLHGGWQAATFRDTCSRSPPTRGPGSATVIALQSWTPTDFRCAAWPVLSSGALRRHAVHEVWIASCYKPSRR